MLEKFKCYYRRCLCLIFSLLFLASEIIKKSEFSLAPAFVGVGHNAPDEERLVLLKPVVHFLFTYGVLRGLLFNYPFLY